jgi:hypothetical protein
METMPLGKLIVNVDNQPARIFMSAYGGKLPKHANLKYHYVKEVLADGTT